GKKRQQRLKYQAALIWRKVKLHGITKEIKDWNSDNVQNLCRGTSNPTEPPRCFDRVMHGGINWGGGTRWQWQNALDLCAGTNDAEATINCFQARIGQGVQWPAAIRDGKYHVITLGRWPSFRAKRTPGPLPLSL